jgi:hypothetical protein
VAGVHACQVEQRERFQDWPDHSTTEPGVCLEGGGGQWQERVQLRLSNVIFIIIIIIIIIIILLLFYYYYFSL